MAIEPQTKISTVFLHDNKTNRDIKYFLYTWAVSNVRERAQI